MKKKKASASGSARDDHSGEPRICRNCGQEDTGRYCSSCGQSFDEVSKPLRELLLDLLGAFNLDSSLFRSVGPFLFRPGFLTGEYLAGRRKKYMSPVRLYLVMSLVFFFLAREASQQRIINAGNLRYQLGNDTNKIVVTGDSALLEILRSDSLYHSAMSPADSLNNWGYEQTERIRQSALKTVTNKQLFINNLFGYISYILFLLMPVFALLLHLLCIRRKRYYIEHLLFSVNMHSFALFVLSLLVGLKLIIKGNDGYINMLVLVLPVYFTAGMMRFYKQGFLKIFLKEIILAIIYTMLVIFSLVVAVFLAFLLI